ncbi:endocuticle structural glycoprotein SgAbd-2-like [Neodiprion fabricii]|uniref:endocuticle structural glycoprotein SgAbd-2-like n=1 Tax=Neodiprion fabricii TaxID=2872261 RepID=UPI001ED918A5|nr:endocuticle structural glycoprotein SgAbd-2-like [Neodiprion fabricii]
MKFLIVSLSLAVVASAQYKEPLNQNYAKILRQDQEVNPDGTYDFTYETENGISAAAKGGPVGSGPNGELVIQEEGGFQYTAPDGQVIAVRYIAGPNGFVPEGAHLPVAPPIPEAILRSIEFNRANERKEAPEYRPPQTIYQPSTTARPFYPSSTVYPSPNPFGRQPNFYNRPGYQQG